MPSNSASNLVRLPSGDARTKALMAFVGHDDADILILAMPAPMLGFWRDDYSHLRSQTVSADCQTGSQPHPEGHRTSTGLEL
jgi:hypothetical protein